MGVGDVVRSAVVVSRGSGGLVRAASPWSRLQCDFGAGEAHVVAAQHSHAWSGLVEGAHRLGPLLGPDGLEVGAAVSASTCGPGGPAERTGGCGSSRSGGGLRHSGQVVPIGLCWSWVGERVGRWLTIACWPSGAPGGRRGTGLAEASARLLISHDVGPVGHGRPVLLGWLTRITQPAIGHGTGAPAQPRGAAGIRCGVSMWVIGRRPRERAERGQGEQ